MPKLAANLTMLFNEHPFMDRFEAAAKAGFKGVEFLFPYAFDANEIAAKLESNKLELVLHNLPAGKWEAGERGIERHEQEDRIGAGFELANGIQIARHRTADRQCVCLSLAVFEPIGRVDRVRHRHQHLFGEHRSLRLSRLRRDILRVPFQIGDASG